MADTSIVMLNGFIGRSMHQLVTYLDLPRATAIAGFHEAFMALLVGNVQRNTQQLKFSQVYSQG